MYHTSKRRTDPLFRESQGKGLRVERSGFYFRSWHRQGFTSCAQALLFVAELYLCRYYMCFLLIFDNWRKYTDLCCLLVRYSNVFQNNIEQDQGASLQETVWTVKRCINGGILSLLMVVVGCSRLPCAILGCTGLFWAVLGCSGLYWAVLGSSGL